MPSIIKEQKGMWLEYNNPLKYEVSAWSGFIRKEPQWS